MTSEAKFTLGAGGLGIASVLVDMLRSTGADGKSMLSEPVLIAIIVCVTALGISYNISRGLAKYEYPGQTPPSDVPTPPPQA